MLYYVIGMLCYWCAMLHYVKGMLYYWYAMLLVCYAIDVMLLVWYFSVMLCYWLYHVIDVLCCVTGMLCFYVMLLVCDGK